MNLEENILNKILDNWIQKLKNYYTMTKSELFQMKSLDQHWKSINVNAS